jgi:hypothetical protein
MKEKNMKKNSCVKWGWMTEDDKEKTKKYLREHNKLAKKMSDKEIEKMICNYLNTLSYSSNFFPITKKERENYVKFFEEKVIKKPLLDDPIRYQKKLYNKETKNYEKYEENKKYRRDRNGRFISNTSKPRTSKPLNPSYFVSSREESPKPNIEELPNPAYDKATGHGIYPNPPKNLYDIMDKEKVYPSITTEFQKYLTNDGYIELDKKDKEILDKTLNELCEKYTEKYTTIRYTPEPKINKETQKKEFEDNTYKVTSPKPAFRIMKNNLKACVIDYIINKIDKKLLISDFSELINIKEETLAESSIKEFLTESTSCLTKDKEVIISDKINNIGDDKYWILKQKLEEALIPDILKEEKVDEYIRNFNQKHKTNWQDEE